MFVRIGRLVTLHPRLVLGAALLAVIVSAVFGIHAPGRLQGGGFTSPSAPSQVASDRLEHTFRGSPGLIFVVEARTGTVDGASAAAAGAGLAARVAHSPGVTSETDYWSSHSPALRSRDGRQALVIVNLAGGQSTVRDSARNLINRLSVPAGRPGPVTVVAGGGAAVNQAVSNQIAKDLALAEGLAIPITALLLVITFGSAVAALLPVAIGVTSIFFTLFVLWVLSGLTSVSVYAINLTTAMGLGLGIDYSLLIVNRYREELARGRAPDQAVTTAIATAGRTVTFSAATVAAALAALLVFPVYFLRSFAYAGISVVFIATVSAIVVLPALLALLGPRVNAGRVPGLRSRSSVAGGSESPFWRAVATRVMARPLAAGLPVVAVLLLAGAPFLHVHFGTPDDRVLPTSVAARQAGDALRSQFAANASDTVDVVTARALGPSAAEDYSRALSRLAGVVAVKGPAGVWSGGVQTVPAGALTAGYQAAGASWFEATITPDPLSGAAARLVGEVRALPAPVTTYVGGSAASLVDQKHDLASRLPVGLALIAITTFIILFLFTGSIVLPVKALVLNALSLTAVFGAMVWVFQDGHLSGLLGFTPTPTSTTMPLLLFCIAFGLSMDYEVFLLSRIKELHDAGATNEEAVAGGLARTGRIVTTAAALLAVTFFAFGLSKVSFIQLFGLGTALAILVDATLVRGVLVPAFMGLAGRANWWAPPSLRRLHRRIGLAEAVTP